MSSTLSGCAAFDLRQHGVETRQLPGSRGRGRHRRHASGTVDIVGIDCQYPSAPVGLVGLARAIGSIATIATPNHTRQHVHEQCAV